MLDELHLIKEEHKPETENLYRLQTTTQNADDSGVNESETYGLGFLIIYRTNKYKRTGGLGTKSQEFAKHPKWQLMMPEH